MAGTTAYVANDEFVQVPKLLQSEELGEALESVLTGADGPPLAIPYSITRNFLTRRVKRACQEMEVVADYPAPRELALECAIQELRELLQSIATRGRRPLVFQDLAGIFVPSPGSRATVFATPDGEGRSMPCGEDDAAMPFDPKVTLEDIEIDMVMDHAEFIADSEPFVLQRMCPTLATKTFRPLVDYWRAQFARLDEVEDGPFMRKRAERALDAAFGRV
ncbi:MAG: hypothetical protein AAFR52_00060 [Pseudomonadota bacterium]